MMGDWTWKWWRFGYRKNVIPVDNKTIMTMGSKHAFAWRRIGNSKWFYRDAKINHRGLYWNHPLVEQKCLEHKRIGEDIQFRKDVIDRMTTQFRKEAIDRMLKSKCGGGKGK
jgi:hypothetical protein